MLSSISDSAVLMGLAVSGYGTCYIFSWWFLQWYVSCYQIDCKMSESNELLSGVESLCARILQLFMLMYITRVASKHPLGMFS